MGRNVNYFKKSKAECQFSKLGCVESSFAKTREYQYNLPKLKIKKKKKKTLPEITPK